MEKNRLKTILFVIILLVCIIFFGSLSRRNTDAAVPAANTLSTTQNTGQNTALENYRYSSAGIYFRLLLAVLLVAAMGFGVYWLSRYFACKTRGGKSGRIEILETAYLAARKTLHVVKIGNRTFLIGSTNDSIRSLAELTEEFPEENL